LVILLGTAFSAAWFDTIGSHGIGDQCGQRVAGAGMLARVLLELWMDNASSGHFGGN